MKILKHLPFSIVLIFLSMGASAQEVGIWMRFEKEYTSSKDYANPLHDIKFNVRFTSPTGRAQNISGFWDGARSFKVRFMPDEKGVWRWSSESSDKTNAGLNGQTGSFNCVDHRDARAIYSRGAITRTPGLYHLEHADGTPFFWTACTAWNGTLKSTEDEWKDYLQNRVDNHYNVIQFVATQWRAGENNSLGEVAFDGSGVININPSFFRHLDKKIDAINQAGLVAAPVLLWALPSSLGRHLNPGYVLPEPEAVLLARYMVARYGSHHVVWILGGDGKFIDQYEHRWKNIGRGVFADEHPGLVALHPQGKAWIGDVYAEEEWLDIVGYQSGHDDADIAVTWITKGPVASRWKMLPPKVFINMEPIYEEARPDATADDVRKSSYWSILSTPTAGITYGALGIWPWLREGEEILNHGSKGEKAKRWRESLQLPGSIQVGYLGAFMRTLNWWDMKPAPELLVEQPGDTIASRYVSVSRTGDRKTIVAYVPSPVSVSIRNPAGISYEGSWFDPIANRTTRASLSSKAGILVIASPPGKLDHMLVLKAK